MVSSTPKPRVAIVEDNAHERQVLAGALRSDFEVLEAADHDGAYRLLREQAPDVLLLKLNLPSGSVRECLALRRELGLPDFAALAEPEPPEN